VPLPVRDAVGYSGTALQEYAVGDVDIPSSILD
jgi:hypothetical protein